jgi:hypothetical protein
LIKEFATSAPSPTGDSAPEAMYQAGSQDTDFTIFKEAGFLGLNFGLVDSVASHHHITDTVARLDPAGLQHVGENMLGLTQGLSERDLAGLRSENDTVFFTVFGHLIAYPMGLVWPLAGLALAAVIAAGVLARHCGAGAAGGSSRARPGCRWQPCGRSSSRH